MQRGLLLVLCPILLQVLLITCLVGILFRTQILAEQEVHRKILMGQCHKVTMAVWNTAGLVAVNEAAQGFGNRDIVDKAFFEARQCTDSLMDMLSEYPDKQESLARVRRASKATWAMFEDFTSSSQRHDFYMNTTAGVEKAFTEITELTFVVNDILLHAGHEKQEDYQQRMAWRFGLRICFVLAIVGSVGLAVYLALFYGRSIRTPIMTLCENARRLSQRLPLLTRMRGNDELAALDRTLHDVDKAVELALERDNALIENAADLICTIDRNLVLREVNPFAARLLGCDSDELIGRSVSQLVLEADRTKFESELKIAISGEPRTFEARIESRNRGLLDTLWSTMWSEREMRLFCVVHNISEHKAIERLKQEFIDMVSHDLRSPLQSVMVAIETLRAGGKGELPEEIKADLGDAGGNLKQLIGLINDLLDFEKLQAGQMAMKLAPCSLNGVCEEACQLVMALAREHKVVLKTPEHDVVVLADASKLLRVFLNLLSNALKYSPEGGLISIDYALGDGEVEVSVTDQGQGLPEEYRDIIFLPFQQAPGEHPSKLDGTGLGLATCKLIAQGHGGTIGVRSATGKGTTFWFRIPAHKG
jgi:PAS domain S-box-containing protein